MAELERIVKHIESEFHAISFVDILFNHTSFDSEWLNDCPDALFNEKTVPQLRSAILLDIKLQEFSEEIAAGKVDEYGKKNLIENAGDVELIMTLVRKKVF